MFNSLEVVNGDGLDVHGYPPFRIDLISAFAEGDGFDGLEQVHEVDPDGPVADVPGVHGDALFVGGVAAAAGLPHAGDAGQDHAVLAEVVAVALDFFGDNRARADEAHVAADDVPELRQLVEAGLPEEGAELGDARVVLELEVLLPLFAGLGVLLEVFLEGFLCVRDHGLELVAREEHAIPADALMREDDMALVADGDHDGQHDEYRRNEDAADGRADEVEDALDDAVATARKIVPHVEHEDFFAEEHFCLSADHRDADEVGRKGDVAHVGLYLGDELLELVAVHAWHGDDDGLDAGVADDGLGIGDLAVEQEARGDFLGKRVIVDEADDVVAVAEVIPVIAQDALGRLARADEDDRLVEQMALLDERLGEVADQVEIRHQEDDEESDEEARGQQARGGEINDNETGHKAVEHGEEDVARRVEDGVHLPVGMGLSEEQDEDQRDPEVDVLWRDGIGRGVPVDQVMETKGLLLGQQDGDVVEQDEQDWVEIAGVARAAYPRPVGQANHFFQL